MTFMQGKDKSKGKETKADNARRNDTHAQNETRKPNSQNGGKKAVFHLLSYRF
jgi:hypothetical protein